MNWIELTGENKEQINELAGDNLLQSWIWGEFQLKAKQKIFRYGLKEGNNLTESLLLIKYDLPLGWSYLYIPRGPGLREQKNWPEIYKNLIKLADKEKAVFIRIEPYLNGEDLPEIFKKSGKIVKKAKRAIQPAVTWLTDLTQSDDDLLISMHHKTRYNIRLAKKKGVEVKISTEEKYISDFYKLMEATSGRNQFAPHPRSYYTKELEVLGQTKNAALFLALYQEKVIAANLVTFFGKRATYLHGASDYEHRKLMAPYLLQWQAILEAKSRGCVRYDWHGITLDKNHPWAGITRFKQGFGGEVNKFPGTFDIILQPIIYKAYRAIQKGN